MDTPQQQLRLVGVHEDGEHLLLSDPQGTEFTLEITDALRAAATRPIGRPSAAAADDAATVLSPKDIQAKIRAGATAEQLADSHGLDPARLRTYEAPVLAERGWIATQAQGIEVSSPQPGNDLYRSVFGDDPAALGPMVRHRLTALGFDASTLQWNAWREEGETSWTISAEFSTEGGRADIGDHPPALWSFRPASKQVGNLNRWAQVLSELESDSPFGTRRLSAVTDHPFDFDAAPAREPEKPAGPRPAVDPEAQEELLDVLHARRGQRLGVDEEGDDELALMLTREEHPSTWTRPQLVVTPNDAADNGDSSESSGAADQPETDDAVPAEDEHVAGTEAGDQHTEQDSATWIPRLHSHTSLKTEQYEVSSEEIEGQTDAFEGLSEDETGQALKSERSSRVKNRKNRPSVPSWDEIMFGTKSD
ncbi:septation protein SepH [Citricoccus muralis]|uniref:Septation protein SepH n=1 Tax=Citricoccus muralis TaxID=169134 RepID=A0ABY8H3D3_9MICC|nr:septation protein SepH [Citricoccus muralis]WFP15461.1 septation protein SepH [Citricoccus muralis]